MCFGPSTLGAGAKTPSRIQNKELRHIVYAHLHYLDLEWGETPPGSLTHSLTHHNYAVVCLYFRQFSSRNEGTY